MNKTKSQKAITLVALIITIIVLLILAVAAIRVVSGDGILQYAKNSTVKYEEKAMEEKTILEEYENYIKNEPVAQNERTGEYYTVLNDAFVDNEGEEIFVEGDQINLIVDLVVSNLNIDAKATLNLNGHILRVDNIYVNEEAYIIDTLTEEGHVAEGSVGRLRLPINKVGTENCKLAVNNPKIPFRVEEETKDGYYSYQFIIRLKMQQQTPVVTNGALSFAYRPSLVDTNITKQYFSDGCANEGLQIGIRLIVTELDGKVNNLEGMRDDDNVAYIYTNNRAFQTNINDVTKYYDYGKVEVTSLVKSETGVEQVGTIYLLDE